jgi:hypothetical protein
VEKPAATTFVPALIKQSHHVQADLHPVGIAVIRPELELLGRYHRALEPELLKRFFVYVLVKAVEENAGEFTGAKPAIESFEPVNFLLDCFGDRQGPLCFDHLDIIGNTAQHALLGEPSDECPHRIGVRACFLGSLCRRTLFKEDQGTNAFVAPLHLIRDTQLQWGEISCWLHRGWFPSH